MTWLRDLARSRAAQRASGQQKRKDYERAFAAEQKRVSSFIKNLLKEIGKAYWGSVGQSYTVEHNDGSWTLRTTGKSSGYHYWSVDLSRADNERLIFEVTCNHYDALRTPDTSEAALEEVLRDAVQRGPRYRTLDL